MGRTKDDAPDTSVYRVLLESAPDALIATNSEGIILFANGQAHRLLGYDPDDLIGEPIEVIIPERLREYHIAHRRAFVADPKLRPMGTGMELLALKRDGTEFPVEISLSPVDTASGAMVAAAVRDVSARKKVEQTLRKAKQDAEHANLTKSRFLAAASHDLRQPLQATQMYLTALSQLLQDDSGYELIHRMQLSTNSLTEILNALLDIARLDTGQVEPEFTEFPILELMQQIMADSMVHAKHKNLEIRLVSSKKHVYSDRRLLGSILSNLVSNAVRNTPSGRVLIGCRPDGDHLMIQVWDTGPGIPVESRDAIFEEYFQLATPELNRGSGPGLGLAIVKRLANLLDYSISLQSTVGKGSMFAVSVPLGNQPIESSEQIPASRPPNNAQAKISILFIEDDPDIVTATSLILNLQGYEVHTAGNSQQAYDHIAENGLEPDIILADCRLSSDAADAQETGVNLVQKLRNLLNREIPVVFMTADTSITAINESQLRNCEVLHKPIDSQELNAALMNGLIAGSLYTVH
jgi:PAS domain S-box-containing protein